jgi:sugar/nucleoside kinase (ribokinase family)
MGAMAEGGAAIAHHHQQQQQPVAIDACSAVVAAAKNSFPSQNGFSHHPFSQSFVLDAEEEEEEGGGGGGEGGSDAAVAAVAAGVDYGYGQQQQQQQQQEKCPPVVVGLQPVALVDHVAKVDWSLLDAVPGERGGSMRVTAEELDHILAEVNTHMLPVVSSSSSAVRTLAGGSVANTIRGLAGGLGIRTSLVGVRGDDERGQMFAANMKMAGVDLSRLREVRGGRTAQCACLVDAEGNRTMRPCFLNAVGLKAEELSKKDFRGAQWLVLNGYGFYGTELLETAVQHAKQEGVKISMDLASFEVVRNFRPRLMRLLESGNVDLVFANEDEARELIKGEEEEEENKDLTSSSPESSLRFLANYCERAVVMLGAKGCIARHGKEMVRVSAIRETVTVDTTGAGDLFASGFLYGILNNLSLEDCCKMGCCTGGAVVRGLGGEIAEEGWQWMHQQLIAKQLPPIRVS